MEHWVQRGERQFRSSDIKIVLEKLQSHPYPQRKKMLRVTVLLLAILSISSYSIEGNWTLTSVRYVDLGNDPIVLSISDYVFKSKSILQKLIFSGCQRLLLQAQFNENQVFINGKTYYREPIPNITCGNSNNILNSIYSTLNSVFFFEINIDILLFNDAYGSNVMSFKRVVQRAPVNITGIWNMNQYGNTQTSLSIQVSNTQITLCQGNLIFNYNLVPAQNLINLIPVLSNCPSQNLTNAVKATKYFRLNNGILNFYDPTVALTVGLVYSGVFDPSKPIFGGQAQSPAPSPQANPPSGPLPISTSNLGGTWYIISLFNVPLSSSPYKLIFTANSIQLVGGCGNYTFPYTINSTTQIITPGSFTPSISNTCSQSDDQLYTSGVSKMYKYLLSNTNGVSTLSIYDATGSIGYSLKSVPPTAKPAGPTAAAPAAPPQPLSPGTYLLLLLARRDLPRLLVNVTSNNLAYKSCNKIQQTFTPARLTGNQGSIAFAGGPLTNSTCAMNNDQVYYGTLNLGSSYKFDPSAGAVVISNAAGVEIATLSSAS